MPYNYKLVILLSTVLTFAGTQALASGDKKAHHDMAAPAAEEHAPHWSYQGLNGPESWGTLSSEYSTCATGTQQSPIDINSVRMAQLGSIDVNWKPFVPTVVNNGHTIQVNTDGIGSMVLEGKNYTLLQFHFHHNSEHTINGRHYPLEAHFVHKAEDGSLGVLGVFFKEGSTNPALQKIWDIAPLEAGEMSGKKKFKPTALLPRNRSYFRYEGSLTTPPCSEIVDWVVFGQPMEASKAQIEAFAGLYADNYRPVQNTNRRYILHTQ